MQLLKNYILKNEPNLKFIDNFFDMDYKKPEEELFYKFFNACKLYNKYLNIKKVSKILKMHPSTIGGWIKFKRTPFLVKLLNYNLKLKTSQNKWLSINSTKGGSFTGPWVSVPLKIKTIKDIKRVLDQIEPLENFNFLSKKYEVKNRLNLFFYLFGVIVGDASKHPISRKNRTTRRIQLRLTKKYPSCEKLGEFTILCLNNLGLRMNRCKDCPKGKRNPYDFYAWHSQCSPLIEWIFTIVLGLNTNKKTTYDKINCNWLLNIDRNFKISFLQGLSDSDGFIDITTRRAGIITGPNTDFVIKLLDTLNIKTKKWHLHKGTLGYVSMNLNKAYSLPLFNESVKLYRYNLMKKIMEARRLPRPFPRWLIEKINSLILKGYSSTKIIHKILNEDNISISQGGIAKRMKKLKTQKILGIESTAPQ